MDPALWRQGIGHQRLVQEEEERCRARAEERRWCPRLLPTPAIRAHTPSRFSRPRTTHPDLAADARNDAIDKPVSPQLAVDAGQCQRLTVLGEGGSSRVSRPRAQPIWRPARPEKRRVREPGRPDCAEGTSTSPPAAPEGNKRIIRLLDEVLPIWRVLFMSIKTDETDFAKRISDPPRLRRGLAVWNHM